MPFLRLMVPCPLWFQHHLPLDLPKPVQKPVQLVVWEAE